MKTCDVKDCEKEGTETLGTLKLCVPHNIHVAYDCLPLPLKEPQDRN